jgi:methyl halide transferase
MAVLGCGRGYDALLFASHGFEVVGFDFAPMAIAQAHSLILVTHNSREFSRVAGLQLEDWEDG